MRSLIYFILVLPGLVASLMGCKKNDLISGNPVIPPGDSTMRVTKIKISDSETLLLPTYTKLLSVTITPANASGIKIKWRSNNNAIATVDANGMVTGVLEGACYIIGSSEENASAIDSIKIIVLKTYDVYVAGVAQVFNRTSVAAYWNNGIFSALDRGYSASAIAVSNNNVYIAGTALNQYGFAVATYWKQGEVFPLFSEINNESYATSVALSGDTAYIAGWDWKYAGSDNNFLSHAHYWKCFGKNIVEVPLFDSNVVSAYANAITLSNGNVYVAGTQANDNVYSMSKYWVNNFNVGTAFTNGSFAQANGIAVQGGNVYVVGADGCENFGCVATAKLWKNTSSGAIALTDGSKDATAFCVALSGNTIYASGYEYNASGKRVAKLWMINGSTVQTLQITDGKTDAIIRSIAIVGDDIFLAGWEMDDSTGYRNAKYWRVYDRLVLPVPLTSGYPESSEADGIFVQ